MKKSLILLLFTAFAGAVYAGDKKPANKNADKGSLLISLTNHTEEFIHKDSVLVIFDKFDLTGAGIIRNVYYPDASHSLVVKDIPLGKYYVMIQCIGFHYDHYERIISVGKQKKHIIRIKLKYTEDYIPKTR